MSEKPKIRTLSIKHEPSFFKGYYDYSKGSKGFIFRLSLGNIIHPKFGMIIIRYESQIDERC